MTYLDFLTGEVNKSVKCLCQIFSGFNIPKIIKIVQIFTELFLKNKKGTFFGDTGYIHQKHFRD